MRFRDIVLALLAVTILGSSFVVIKMGLRDVPPLLLTGLRFLFSAVPAVFFLRPPAAAPRYVTGFGLALGVGQFGLLFPAIHLGMPAGVASLVVQMQVFFTAGLAFAVFGERPGAVQIAGGLVAACGIAIIGLWHGGGTPLVPLLMVLAAAGAWSVANIISKRTGRVDRLAFIAWSSLAAVPPLFILSALIEGPAAMVHALAPPGFTTIWTVAFLAIATNLVAFSIWTDLISRYPAPLIMPFGFLIPVAGISSSTLLLGEPFGRVQLAGSLLVLFGLGLNLWSARPQRAPPEPSPPARSKPFPPGLR